MRRIGIVGAGQADLSSASACGNAVTTSTGFAERPADDVRAGRLVSNQCLFHPALERERALGIDFWEARPSAKSPSPRRAKAPSPPFPGASASTGRPGRSTSASRSPTG